MGILKDGEGRADMLDNIGISIIMPTYNRERLVLRSIQSILDQTYTNWELIIVDDGSTDSTQQVVQSVNDQRISYIKNQKNMGAALSRNKGVQLANYNYLAFQDSDDVWKPGKLEKQMCYLSKHAEFDLVYSSFVNHHLDGRKVQVPNDQIGEREGNLLSTLLINNVIGTPTILVKKETFENNRGFDETLCALEDWDFVLRVSESSRIGFIPDVLVEAYQTKGSLSCDGAGYFHARCKMLTSHYREMQELGLFDDLVGNLFREAEKHGILESVQKLFMRYLEYYMERKC